MDQLTPLEGSMQDFQQLSGSHLLDRLTPFFAWQQVRREAQMWPFTRATQDGPKHVCSVRDDQGQVFTGINLASQDYLSLSVHPQVRQAAMQAIEQFGVHSAGSPALIGNTSLSLALEEQLAAFTGYPHITLYPTGWSAGFGVIKALVRENDHIIIDRLAHACLQEGARASTRNIHAFKHNDLANLCEQLKNVRAHDRINGVLVVSESLFSMDSDTPDLQALQALASEHGATLLVDMAHDLGCLGEHGWGHAGIQGMRGNIDVVMGSFSKTFAANGGFVACRQRSVAEYLRFYSSPHTFSNALSPIQSAVVVACVGIVTGAEGARLRHQLMANIILLRKELATAGFETYGQPSPIVCVKMGTEALARLVCRELPGVKLLCNLVEFPAVAKGAARFRLQVMAKHQAKDLKQAASRLRHAYQTALLHNV